MTSTFTLVIAVVLTVIAVWTILWLFYSMILPFIGCFISLPHLSMRPGFSERWKFRRCVRALNELSAAIQQENIRSIQKLVPRALFLERIRYSPELIAKSSHHHLDLLNQLIIVAEFKNRSVRNLPTLEMLFGKRTELLASAVETRSARSRFRDKQRQKGKTPPRWSTGEFDSKLRELDEGLDEVHQKLSQEILTTLQSLFSQDSHEQKEEHYH